MNSRSLDSLLLEALRGWRWLGVLGVGLGCGAKSELDAELQAALDLLPECRVEGAERECETICGSGTEVCVGGEWQECDAPRPRPPRLGTVIRDFRDSHPDFEQRGRFAGHDRGIVEEALGPDDLPVYAGNPNTRSTNGRENFDMWFRDVRDRGDGSEWNIRFDSVTIQLQPSASDPNLFVYNSSAFFPIDGLGFGNQGRSHNYHFTLQLTTSFRYVGGETFRFSGDDDLWVFINRKLAIDLGGQHEQLAAQVDLDRAAERLGIEKGEIYPLHLFFAERHTVASNFNIATTIAEFEFCD